MAEIILNLEALGRNAEAARRLGGSWNLELLPVMKMVDGHPAAALTLHNRGFRRLAYGGVDEARRFGGLVGWREQRVMIGLTLPKEALTVAEIFGRSLQSRPEMLIALDEAAGALGLSHEVLLTLDLGGGREGLADIGELGAVLDLARNLGRVKLMGLAVTVGCLDGREPGPDFRSGLVRAVELLRERGGPGLVSAGGSILLNWLRREPPTRTALINELRVGDPFFLGRDSWRNTELPGGPFRRDVLSVAGTVAEIRDDRALVDLGRFHLGDRPLECLWPGSREIGRSSGCLVLALDPEGTQPAIGDRIMFHPDYWNAAAAFRNPSLPIRVIPELGERSTALWPEALI